MVNSNVKGREAENRLYTFFTLRGYECELLRLQGLNDPGDLWVPSEDSRIEIKNHKNVLSAINEAIHDVELLDARFPLSKNYAVVTRPGQPPENWYVVRRCGSQWPVKPGSPADMFAGNRGPA